MNKSVCLTITVTLFYALSTTGQAMSKDFKMPSLNAAAAQVKRIDTAKKAMTIAPKQESKAPAADKTARKNRAQSAPEPVGQFLGLAKYISTHKLCRVFLMPQGSYHIIEATTGKLIKIIDAGNDYQLSTLVSFPDTEKKASQETAEMIEEKDFFGFDDDTQASNRKDTSQSAPSDESLLQQMELLSLAGNPPSSTASPKSATSTSSNDSTISMHSEGSRALMKDLLGDSAID